MTKQIVKRLDKLEKHFGDPCSEEKALAELWAWCDANPSDDLMDGEFFDFYAWLERVPPLHKKALSYWIAGVLESMDGNSSELVLH